MPYMWKHIYEEKGRLMEMLEHVKVEANHWKGAPVVSTSLAEVIAHASAFEVETLKLIEWPENLTGARK